MSLAVAVRGFSHRQELERLGQAFLSMPEFLRGQYERSVWPDRYVSLQQTGYSTVFYLPQRFADTASLHVLVHLVTQAVPVQVGECKPYAFFLLVLFPLISSDQFGCHHAGSSSCYAFLIGLSEEF